MLQHWPAIDSFIVLFVSLNAKISNNNNKKEQQLRSIPILWKIVSIDMTVCRTLI